MQSRSDQTRTLGSRALPLAGFTTPEAARRMGHSAVVHIGVYAHPIERMDGKRYDGLDALIGAARGELAGLVFPVSSPQSR